MNIKGMIEFLNELQDDFTELQEEYYNTRILEIIELLQITKKIIYKLERAIIPEFIRKEQLDDYNN